MSLVKSMKYPCSYAHTLRGDTNKASYECLLVASLVLLSADADADATAVSRFLLFFSSFESFSFSRFAVFHRYYYVAGLKVFEAEMYFVEHFKQRSDTQQQQKWFENET